MGNFDVFENLRQLQHTYEQIQEQREANSYETYETQWNYHLDEDIVAETPCGNEEKVFEFVVGY